MSRKLGLKKDKKVIAGVGSGLGEWVGVSEWVVRFIAVIYFLLAFNWYGLLWAVVIWIATYIVLWLVLKGIKNESLGANTVKKRKR